MYIKMMKMENFKSFHKKTVIPFEKGFTAVTGPNGSGKSNISDAIIFVLGQKGSRALRAQKLTDLIFNGGANRDPATHASVSIVFDNKSREIAIDSDEIEITRTIRLSPNNPDGYSSNIYINNKKVSHTDLETILDNARINMDSFNIVQQGDITSVIEIGSKERRKIIDTISGVSVYDVELLKAEEKKVAIEENVSKIEIIKNETEQRLKMLEHDKKDAEKYRDILSKMEEERLAIKWKEYLDKVKSIDGLMNQIKETGSEVEHYKEELKKVDDDLTEAQKEQSNLISKINEKEQYKNEVTSKEYQQNAIMEAKLTEKMENIEAGIKDINSNMNTSKTEIEKRKKRIIEYRDKIDSLKTDKEDKENRFKTVDDELTLLKKNHTSNLMEYNELEKRRISIEKELEKMKEMIQLTNGRMEQLRKEKDKKIVEKSEIDEECKRIKFEITDLEKYIKSGNITKLEKETEELKNQFYKNRGELTSIEKEKEEIEGKLRTLTRDRGKLEGKKEILTTSDGSEYIISLRNSGSIEGIIGHIKELISVDEKYRKAVLVAIGSRINSVVVRDENVASECISYLKEKKLGRTTFLPLNKLLDGRPRGKALMVCKNEHAIGMLIEIIKFNEEYRKAIWYAVGDTVLVDSIESAKSVMGGVRLITVDGDLIEANGAMIGGFTRESNITFGSSANATDLENLLLTINKLESRLDMLKQKKADVDIYLKDIEAKLNINMVEIGKLNEKSRTGADELIKLKKDYNVNTSKAEMLDKDINGYTDEISKVERDLESFNESVSKLNADYKNIKEELLNKAPKEIVNNLEKLEKLRETYQKEINGLTSSIVELSTTIENENKRIHELEDEIKIFTYNMANNKDELNKIKKELDVTRDKIKSSELLISSIISQYGELKEQLEKQKKEIDRLNTKREAIKGNISNRQIVVDTLTSKCKEIQEEIKIIEPELKMEMKENFKNVSKDELISTVNNQERMLKEMGNVNMKAIEEYQEIRHRLDELVQSLDKMDLEKKEIQKVTEEINIEKKNRFLQVFYEINKNFKEIYGILSSGGEAEILLDNYEDPFNGGLIIKAKPIGKKVQRIEALSGGEKSLTSLTFIMSIQKYLPSPFYVLDEVDMFLDAVSAERIGKMIKRLSENTQIVMISLRKATLREADRIYGVTQQGDGISMIISKDIISIKDHEIPDTAIGKEGEGGVA